MTLKRTTVTITKQNIRKSYKKYCKLSPLIHLYLVMNVCLDTIENLRISDSGSL